MIVLYLPVVFAQAVGAALGSVVTPSSLFAIFPLAAVLTASGAAAGLLTSEPGNG